MRPKFLADADLNQNIISGLLRREPSIDFIDASDGGTRGLPDPDVLRLAAISDRILVSHDRKTMIGHFKRFVQHTSSPGLIIVKQRMPVKNAIAALLLIWAASEAEEWRDQFEFATVIGIS